jgi:hypothetical protein
MSPETLKWGLFGVAVGFNPFPHGIAPEELIVLLANHQVYQ